MNALFEFIDSMCKRYSIDESHGVKHAKGTIRKAYDILETLPDVKENERRVCLYSAALHDTCDSKYTDVEKASAEISAWLSGEGWIQEEIKAVIAIITSMSYSKLKLTSNGGPPMYPDHGRWQRAYHVARHADLLEGYVVARCFLYNQQIHPGISDEDHWAAVRSLFHLRVFRYIADGWITLPAALAMVPALTDEAYKCLEQKSVSWPEPEIHFFLT